MDNPQLYIGTGVNPPYYPKAKMFGYFETVAKHMPPDVVPFAVLLDYDERQAEQFKVYNPDFNIVRMTSQQVKAANPNKCMQHGGFLMHADLALCFQEDDYIIYSDCDMWAQRGFTESEVDELLKGRVVAGTNWHDNETLAEEMTALGPQVPYRDIMRAFPQMDRFICYNTGLLGMSYADWQRLFALYLVNWPKISPLFSNPAKQQWLVSYLLQAEGFDLIGHTTDFVRDIHVHGHNPCTDIRLANSGVKLVDGVWTRNGRPVAFAHNLPR